MKGEVAVDVSSTIAELLKAGGETITHEQHTIVTAIWQWYYSSSLEKGFHHPSLGNGKETFRNVTLPVV